MELNTIVLKFVRLPAFLIGILIVTANACGITFSQDLIQPAPEMPAFTLANLKQSRDPSGRLSISIDYQRTKDGVGAAKLAGRTPMGQIRQVIGQPMDEAAGKLDLSGLFSASKGLDVELYLVVSGSFADRCPYECLVSNVVRIGNINGPNAAAREWTDKENDAYQKDLTGRKPPLSPPTGYQLVQAGTKLIPGMPVKVGRFGEWIDAEVLTSESQATVKISGLTTLRKLSRNGWIAIKPATLQLGDSSPNSFKPSAQVIPGTTLELPEGYVVLTDSIQVVPGTPVRADWDNQLIDATVIAQEADRLLIHFDSQPSVMDHKLVRNSVVIAESTLEQLAKPDAAQQFESRLPKKPVVELEIQGPTMAKGGEFGQLSQVVTDSSIADSQQGVPQASGFGTTNTTQNNATILNNNPNRVLSMQNNPIDIPIPKEAELVPLDFPLPRGTKLAACSGRRWNYVTVIKESTDDNVPIHWDDRTSDSDGLIHRSQLIIRRIDLKKMRAKAVKPEKRDWTDSTGKYKVDAKLSVRTATHITLIKDDGKEVTLPIDKLSAADQKWLKENP